METIEIIGLIAATMTTSAFIPQLIKVIKLKSTKDISLAMYLVMFTGVVLWLIYGLHHNSIPIIFANIITAVLTFALILFKIKYK
jgi:MtN3 and saliva related transmembrane protein